MKFLRSRGLKFYGWSFLSRPCIPDDRCRKRIIALRCRRSLIPFGLKWQSPRALVLKRHAGMTIYIPIDVTPPNAFIGIKVFIDSLFKLFSMLYWYVGVIFYFYILPT